MMAWTSYLRFRRTSGKPRRVLRRPAPRFRPTLEALEGRVLPSTIVWINPAGGDWDIPSNWSTARLPGPSDDVIIEMPGATVTHAATAADSVHSLMSQNAIIVSRGSLALCAPSTVANSLTVSGGTLAGPGPLTVRGLFTWTGGTLRGGSLTADGGMVIKGPGAVNLNGFTVLDAARATGHGKGIHGGPQVLPADRHQTVRAADLNPTFLMHTLVFADANAFAAPTTAGPAEKLPPSAFPPSGTAFPERIHGSSGDGTDVQELTELVLEAAASWDATHPSELALSALSRGALHFQAVDDGQAMDFLFDTGSTTDSYRSTAPKADPIPDEEFEFPATAGDEGALAPERDGALALAQGVMGVEAPVLSPHRAEGVRLLDAQREPALAEQGQHDSRERVLLVLACLFGPMLWASAGRALPPIRPPHSCPEPSARA
jgi:hypothetical protein